MSELSQIVITVPKPTKAAWVESSRKQGRKLTDWIINRVESMPDFDGFSLNVEAFVPFEAYVRALPDAEAVALFQVLKARIAQNTGDVLASEQIARSYFEKRVAMVQGIASRDLFFDINAWALDYYRAAPELTHQDLLVVLNAP